MNEAELKTYVALLNPRSSSGAMDYRAFANQLEFLASYDLAGFAINGATGEMPGTSEGELTALLETARPLTAGREVFCCVGGATLQETLSRARIAAKARASAVLLPMPYFFQYDQTDAFAFCRAVADSIDLPILLYNLPQFTSGFEVETVLKLLDQCGQIFGIKDSSGSLNIVRALTEQGVRCRRLIGNDAALCDAIREDVCDGVVSGVACVLPELMKSFFENIASSAEFARSEHLLRAFLERIGSLPTPWGLKCASAARDIMAATYSLPVAPERQQVMAELTGWFIPWMRSDDWSHLQPKMMGAR